MTKREELAILLAKHDWPSETADFNDFWRVTKDEYLERVDLILDALMEPDADLDVAISKVQMEHSRADIKVLRGREVLRAILTHIKEGR